MTIPASSPGANLRSPEPLGACFDEDEEDACTDNDLVFVA
jgi:hypothetical protein